ncbi:hypothetical protein NC653_034882 [Populus alba x Populus x berolinensis]|uniref:Uncharacterized protein n=1 Tax=Populus alba x Populus x berolinensis TaxID=444605 RepID=A0AAD6LNQ7_9ROSI|nr:hypothetical protein NC653_034882 [Populus alba x Populus x berolinensis]
MLQKMNLTAVTDVNKVMGRHIEDSLAILPPLHDSYISHYNALSNLFMLGPVLGFLDWFWLLLVLFVLMVCQMLKYERKSRGENLGKKVSFRKKFDVAVARVVAEMRILGGSKKCREVTPFDGQIRIATALRTPMLQPHQRRNKGSYLED